MKAGVAALAASIAFVLPSIATGTHPRPKGASPVRASLVPAYQPCTAPDRTHGPPLAFPSCSGPQHTSARLTVGTPDANGFPAKSVGSFRVLAIAGLPGPPPDNAIGFHIDITDVRCRGVSAGCPGPGDDYSGTLQARIPIQSTDHVNSPGDTVEERTATGSFTLAFDVPCVATADPTIGSSCSRHIDYIEELFLVVQDTQRTLWEFDRLQIWDGGADGDGNTTADNTLFATQGIFIP